MPIIPVSNIARHGIVSDEPSEMQPPQAWTNARNMRFIDGKAIRFKGDAQVMDPPSVAPAHLNVIQTSAGSFWLYASAIGVGSKIYVYNSGTHTDVSQAGDYTADNPEDWSSVIHQGIPIFNNSNGIPQYWPTISPGTDFDDLPNWPTDLTVEILAKYKNYLVALNTSIPADDRPHRVLVSDSAEPGTLPTSWDHDDPAVDALEYDLSDVNSGEILWGAELRDVFVIYKAESTWIMRHIGGQLIMGFDTILQTSGILAKRCAIPLTLPLKGVQVHFVHTGQDLGIFNAQDFESVVDKKVRKKLLADIDPQFYVRSFCVDNPAEDEAWFCYPENGMEEPNIALVWNYRRNTITFRDFHGVHAASGVVEAPSTTTYNSLSSAITYNNVGPLQYQDASRRKLIIADQANTHLIQADLGDDFNGAAFTSVLERVNLAIVGTDPEGNQLLDYESRRLVKRFWPKVTGNPVNVYLGGSEELGQDPVYNSPLSYTPGSGILFCDPEQPLNTVLPAIKIESIDGLPFQCTGYEMEIEMIGKY